MASPGLAAALAVLGLLLGSFLNVVIHRVPRGESVVSPGSRCPGCGTAIRARDNVPVLSWLVLRGRCRHCATRIPVRYPMVELLTGALFAVVGVRFGPSWETPAFLYLAAVSVALGAIDLDVRRLPNVIVLPSYVVAGLLLLLPAEADGRWDDLLRAVAGMAALYGLYLALVLVYPQGMGFGDVKLAGVLGLFLGWLGWGALAVGGFLGFLLGGVTGVALLAAKRAGRKSAIPFGPFMLAGAFVAVLWGSDLSHAYLSLIAP
jgi:leader peptidase (prepilin peptidase) / N-methyltransferase